MSETSILSQLSDNLLAVTTHSELVVSCQLQYFNKKITPVKNSADTVSMSMELFFTRSEQLEVVICNKLNDLTIGWQN